MSDHQAPAPTRAKALREAFDRAFTGVAVSDARATVDLLAIRLGETSFALRLEEITGLFSDRKVTRLPARSSSLLGLAGFRGATLPVYDLRLIMGVATTSEPRWLTIAAAAPVALAFDALDGHLRVPEGSIMAQSSDDRARAHVHEFVRAQETVCAVIDIESVISAIKSQISRTLS